MAVGGRGARLQHHVRAKRGGEEGLGGRPSLQRRVVRAVVCCAAPTIMDSILEILESHDHSEGEKHVSGRTAVPVARAKHGGWRQRTENPCLAPGVK